MTDDTYKLLPEEEALDNAELRENVLKLRVAGKTIPEITQELGIHRSTYQRIIQKFAAEAVARSADLVDEMFLVHYRRLEALYAKTVEAIEASPVFDRELIRTALSILERQSKLLGLDKGGGAPGARSGRSLDVSDRYAWMASATPAEIVREARKLGIAVPPAFELLPPTPVS